jgi:hypothetical protein
MIDEDNAALAAKILTDHESAGHDADRDPRAAVTPHPRHGAASSAVRSIIDRAADE